MILQIPTIHATLALQHIPHLIAQLPKAHVLVTTRVY